MKVRNQAKESTNVASRDDRRWHSKHQDLKSSERTRTVLSETTHLNIVLLASNAFPQIRQSTRRFGTMRCLAYLGSFTRSVSMSAMSRLLLLVTLVFLAGCLDPEQNAEQPKEDKSIVGKKTQDIGEANPNAEQADLQVKPQDGLSAYPKAYGFAAGQLSKLEIKRLVEMYRATHGDYPKDHETFMKEVIQQNNVELPVLPGGRQYQYDVENHELIVVEAKKKKK